MTRPMARAVQMASLTLLVLAWCTLWEDSLVSLALWSLALAKTALSAMKAPGS